MHDEVGGHGDNFAPPRGLGAAVHDEVGGHGDNFSQIRPTLGVLDVPDAADVTRWADPAATFRILGPRAASWTLRWRRACRGLRPRACPTA